MGSSILVSSLSVLIKSVLCWLKNVSNERFLWRVRVIFHTIYCVFILYCNHQFIFNIFNLLINMKTWLVFQQNKYATEYITKQFLLTALYSHQGESQSLSVHENREHGHHSKMLVYALFLDPLFQFESRSKTRSFQYSYSK